MRIRKDESGQTLVLTAAFMGLIALGFLAFAVDVGMLRRQNRMAQNAADAAALAAAEEMLANNTSNEQAVANAMAKLNGFDTTLAKNPAVVTLTTPSSGSFTGTSYITATVSQPFPTLFLGAFAGRTLSVSAQATAGGGSATQSCVCIEGNSGQNINLSNDSTLSASGCGIVSNSASSNAIGIVGSSTLTGLSLGTVSNNWDNSSNINNAGSISPSTTIVQGISSTCAPTRPTAPTYSGCVADPGGSYGTFTFGPSSANGVVCYNGLTIGANGSTVTLNPGTYVINSGTLHFESGSGGHSNLGGNGVFFYLTGSAGLVIDNGANVNLVAGGAPENGGGTATAVGGYNGIVVYQNPTDTTGMSLQGGSSSYINGGLIAPGATLTIGNGSGAKVSGAIDVNSLVMNGGGTLTATTDTNLGSLGSGKAKMVQ